MNPKTLGIALILVLGALLRAEARYQLELESRYLGDGWFEYRLRSVDDPFFLFFDLGSLSVPITNHVEFGPDPADWTSTLTTNGPSAYGQLFASWGYADCGNLACQTRPYERVFRVQSSARHFRRSRDAWFSMSLALVGGYHGIAATGNIVGYSIIPALAPCAAEEADGSPTNLLERLTFVNLPDPSIDNLLRDGSSILGLTFRYPEPSTMRLEATRDSQHWTNVAYIYGNSGATSWTSGVPLNDFGQFYRLRLMAEGHASPLPPLNLVVGEASEGGGSATSAAIAPGTISPDQSAGKVLRCRPHGNGVEVEVQAEPGRVCRVTLLSPSGQPAQSRDVVGTGAPQTVIFTVPASNPVLVTLARLEK